jgi:hypothetical protein
LHGKWVCFWLSFFLILGKISIQQEVLGRTHEAQFTIAQMSSSVNLARLMLYFFQNYLLGYTAV